MHNINDLPPKQREVLLHIVDFLRENHYPPTIQQLCKMVGVSSTSTMHYHLSALKKKGFIHWNESERRAITVATNLLDTQDDFNNSDTQARSVIPFTKPNKTATDNKILNIPIKGTIVAGSPLMPATDDDTEKLNVVDSMCFDGAYLLRVRGESMIEDHIADGDLVLINPGARIRQGDVVVALVEGNDTTLKRYELKGDMVWLHPANSTMQPIVVPSQNVQIQGKVEAVIRSL